jgi:vacuolar-type H+-ATPase subunit E/Vma4
MAQLVAALEADVKRKVTEELEAGRALAERILRTAQERVARERAELLAERETSTRRRLALQAAESEARLRRHLLEAREAALSRVLDRVRQDLAELQTSGAYRQALADELADAFAYVAGEADIVVRGAPGLAPMLARLLDGRPLRLEPDATITAGFRILANGGRIEVDKTLESRLRRMEPQLRIEIVRQLETRALAAADGGAHALG